MRSNERTPPTVPDHEVLRKIGGGAYGDIWMAKAVTGVLRAIKVIWRDDFDNDTDFKREFEGIKQYEPLSRSHPGLIPILHVGRAKVPDGAQFYYYVMELADDTERVQSFHPVEYIPRTLRSDLLSSKKAPIDVDQCIEVGRLTALGLEFLHSQGLAHRDIKPSNIVYHTGVPKLADIGLVAPPGQRTFVGTQGFVPPEGPGTRRADIYALGKILYEMSTGMDRMDFPQLPECPFRGEKAKRWRALNTLICDLCDPREESRSVKTAPALVAALQDLSGGKGFRKKRKVGRVLKSVAAVAVLAVMSTFLIPRLLEQPLTEVSQMVPLKITSQPLGAEVWTPEGLFIGTTPLAGREHKSGTAVTYEFRLDGYATIQQTVLAQAPAVILEATLPIYAPPREGEPWSDAMGLIYAPNTEGGHTSRLYVFQRIFRSYAQHLNDEWKQVSAKAKTNGTKAPEQPNFQYGEVTTKGVSRFYPLVTEQTAKNYCKWITQLSIEQGYLTDDYQILPKRDMKIRTTNWSAKIKNQRLAPFKCVVSKIPYAQLRLSLNVEPEMVIYVDDDPVEYKQDGTEVILRKIKPGRHVITIEAEGFRQFKQRYTLQDNEVLEAQLFLKGNDSVVFDQPWENSMQMMLHPVRDDLMASAHEVSVREYHLFCKELERAIPPKPPFAQDETHPIVNVSRSEAMEFCAWLTRRERKLSLIGRTSVYRLPTDLEWSELAGLSGEEGKTPYERDVKESALFVWGTSWPPRDGAGNLAAGQQDLASDRSITGYSDGYEFTAPVGYSTANSFGLHDIAGNVYEWVSDGFGVGDYGVTRGGSYRSYQRETLYLKFRNITPPTQRNSETGFRIVLAKDEDVAE